MDGKDFGKFYWQKVKSLSYLTSHLTKILENVAHTEETGNIQRKLTTGKTEQSTSKCN